MIRCDSGADSTVWMEEDTSEIPYLGVYLYFIALECKFRGVFISSFSDRIKPEAMAPAPALLREFS